jgi:hypothetical protein
MEQSKNKTVENVVKVIENNKDNNKWNKNYYKNYEKDINKLNNYNNFTVSASKLKKVEKEINVAKMALRPGISQSQVEKLNKSNRTISTSIKTVEKDIPAKIYRNLDNGLYVSEFVIDRTFLFGKYKYSIDEIATFLGLEVNEKAMEINGKVAKNETDLVFIKGYDEIQYMTIDDLLHNPATKEEKKYYNGKEILSLSIVVKDINYNINRVVWFSNIIDGCLKQILGDSY